VGPGQAIHLLDPPDAIRKKIMTATTDSLREVRFDENGPGIYNLLVIYALFSNKSRSEIESSFRGKGYAHLKGELVEVVIQGLQPLQSRYRELATDPACVDSLLAKGAAKVRPIAERTLAIAKERVGLGVS
jgi:tryptophanyl-tRNA synthetase